MGILLETVRLQTFDEWIHIGLCDESIDSASLPPLKARGIKMPRTKKKPFPSNELSEHRQDNEAALPSIAEAKREDVDEKDNQDKLNNGHKDMKKEANEGKMESETLAPMKRAIGKYLRVLHLLTLKNVQAKQTYSKPKWVRRLLPPLKRATT